MPDIAIETLIRYARLNTRVVRMQAEGLTHEESLLQPPFRGNCFNWIVGHIVASRDLMLTSLGATAMLTDAEAEVYHRESEPLTDAANALPLERLLTELNASAERLVQAFSNATADDLARLVEAANGETPLLKQLIFRQWHETYHVGQLELLRQLAGKNDKIV